MLKFLSHCSLFHVAVSARGYGGYKLYTHRYGTTYVGTGRRAVSCDQYIIYVSYLNGYGRGTLDCRLQAAGTQPTGTRRGTRTTSSGRIGRTHHGFLAMATVTTATSTLGTRRGGMSKKLTTVRSGGVPGHRAPVAPPNSLDTQGVTTRYATYRLYMSTYSGRMLHPSAGLVGLVRPRVSCRHKCYHPRYGSYSRMYPAKTVRPVATTSGSSARVKRTI